MLDADNPDQGQDDTTAAGPAAEAAPTEPPTGTAPAPDVTAAEPDQEPAPAKKATKRAPAKKAAAKKTAAKKTATKKTAAKKTTASAEEAPAQEAPAADASQETGAAAPAKTAKKTAAKRATKKTAAKKTTVGEAAEPAPGTVPTADAGSAASDEAPAPAPGTASEVAAAREAAPPATSLLFQPPDPTKAVTTRKKARPVQPEPAADGTPPADEEAEGGPDRPAKKAQKRPAKKSAARADDGRGKDEEAAESEGAGEERGSDEGADREGEGGGRRRRRRGGRRRRRSGEDGPGAENDEPQDTSGSDSDGSGADEDSGDTGSSRRRRRRRRTGEDGEGGGDDPQQTVTRVRKARSPEDEITALSGSTRLEAKKQRRREGREAGRRRAPIVSEAEFLARRESVDRVMVIRQKEDLTQIAVLEDKVLVEHYVARESQTSLIGNVYLGRVQNVLPSMEAAFIDIGKGRNAVLYAGEVNWDSLGAGNGPRKIESVLKSGQSVLVQVTKDPVGHKGARLTSQVSLPGRFLVYVPDGTTSGISRKLPDTERNRLKTLLKEIVPDSAGVIVRTAAEGASEDELTLDVERLTARWEDIRAKVAKGNAPQLLYGEPDLTLKVVRDLFTEDFGKLVVSGADAWDMVEGYVSHVAPDLAERLERYDGDDEPGRDIFADYRIDEQIAKALDRKVWLPSGGSLIIDRTEAMTVVDVNTGKFTGSGGNLEETVTKNNLEAAEEMVRQLRLRDIGGIIVVDFIDMVLESNRDLVLRRLVECLGRDRTRHQVAEVTSLGLVQMTRKRIGTGLLEAFSESCEHCAGRGLIVHHEPIETRKKAEEEPRRSRRGGRGRGEKTADAGTGNGSGNGAPSPKDIAAMARADRPQRDEADRDGEERPDRRPAAEEDRGERAPEETPAGAPPAAEQQTDQEPQPGRRRGRGRGRQDQPAGESQPHDDQPSLLDTADDGAVDVDAGKPSALDEVLASEGTGASASEPTEPIEPAEATEPPAAPATRTVTRKRSARRAQGPAGTAAVVTAPADADGAEPSGTAPVGPADESAEATADQTPETDEVVPAGAVAVAAPAATRVVATTRRRSARRAAGPPSGQPGAATTTDPAADTGPDTGADPGVDVEAGSEGPDGGPLESPGQAHVPIKKKGARKR